MQGKPVRESQSEYSELALPNDANILGNVLGGKVMHLVDLAGALAALRHARSPVVTASVDHMNFLHPVQIGQWRKTALEQLAELFVDGRSRKRTDHDAEKDACRSMKPILTAPLSGAV